MLTICRNEIPDYLKDSKFYENIKSKYLLDKERFEIPKEYYNEEIIINSFDDLISYLKIFNYWQVNKIPDEFYDCIFKNKHKIKREPVIINEEISKILHLIEEICVIVTSTDENICENASERGYLNLLMYAHKNRYIWNKNTCENAARNGHLNCLKYAHNNGCEWDKSICARAAARGHLDCLNYAHENGCPWDEFTCSQAAKYGHLNCLKYAHENGCSYDEDSYHDARKSKYGFTCIEYVTENFDYLYKDWYN